VAKTYTKDPYRLTGITLSGKYRLEEYAGGGGMGAVYRAIQLGSDEQVAIKILKPDVALRNPEYIELFEREVKVVQNLNHPHIVKLFDSGSDQGISYMVMEWLEGQTLESLLSNELLSINRIINIFRQIRDAFAAAHKNHIIHLDIKPANIFLLGNDSDEDFIKVIDFGMSRILSSESGTTVTRFLGTYQYCSPEHFGGKVSNRSDIYSLGATLYHMIAGTLPFGTSYINAKRNLNAEMPPIPSLRGLRSDLPLIVDQVIEKALSKRPADRQRSVEELFEEFYRAVDGDNDKSTREFLLEESTVTAPVAGLGAFSLLTSPQIFRVLLFGGASMAIIGLLIYAQLFHRTANYQPNLSSQSQSLQVARSPVGSTPDVNGSLTTGTSSVPLSSPPVIEPNRAQSKEDTSSLLMVDRETMRSTVSAQQMLPFLEVSPATVSSTLTVPEQQMSSISGTGSSAQKPANDIAKSELKLDATPAAKPADVDPQQFEAAQLMARDLLENKNIRDLWAELEGPAEGERYKFGTLVFFSNLKQVGIVANENGFYHISREKGLVYSPFNDYWTSRLVGFRRAPVSTS
jgi:serine/threonine protein kinase